MAITNWEKDEIKKAGAFLEKLGYIRKEDPYSIEYNLNNIRISVVYPPCEEESDVAIRFIRENKYFSIGWIAMVRDDIKGSKDKLANAKELLKYFENHYLQIKNCQYCMESYDLVDKYVEEHWEKSGGVYRNS